MQQCIVWSELSELLKEGQTIQHQLHIEPKGHPQYNKTLATSDICKIDNYQKGIKSALFFLFLNYFSLLSTDGNKGVLCAELLIVPSQPQSY